MKHVLDPGGSAIDLAASPREHTAAISRLLESGTAERNRRETRPWGR